MFNYGGVDPMRQYMPSNQYGQPPPMQPSNMRRSYEPQPQIPGSKAGVGLLFQTGGDGKITVKEIVKGGSAWRSNLVKPGDVIIRVGNVNVQNQSLANLRELILGENGTFVTLGFSRGGTSEMYEARMMRGTPEYLDSIGLSGSNLATITSTASESAHVAPPPAPSSVHAPSAASNAPNLSAVTQQVSTNDKLQQAPPSNITRQGQMPERPNALPPVIADRVTTTVTEKSTWASGASNLVPASIPTSNSGISAREQDELERLRNALNTSQRDVAELRTKLRTQELLLERNNEELRTYRETIEKRDDEHRQGLHEEDAKRQQQFAEFKQRYDRERAKLVQAIEKGNLLGNKLQAILPSINALAQ